MSAALIGTLQSLLWIGTFIFEVPIGALGDRVGRKPVVIAGRMLIVAYSLLLICGDEFWLFATAFVLFGVGEAAISGADEAWLFQVARDDGVSTDFAKLAGRFSAIAGVVTGLAMSAGGLLQGISWSAVYLSMAALHVGSIVVLLTVAEDRPEPSESPQGLVLMAREVASFVKSWRRLSVVVVAVSLLQSAALAVLIFSPLIMAAQGISVLTISIVMTISTFAGALSGEVAWRLAAGFGDHRFFLASVLGCLGAAVGAALGPWFILPLLIPLLTFCSDVFDPIISREVNSRLSDSIRASFLSIMSNLFSLFAVVLFPLAGWIADTWSMSWMVLSMSVVMGASALAIAVAQRSARAGRDIFSSVVDGGAVGE